MEIDAEINEVNQEHAAEILNRYLLYGKGKSDLIIILSKKDALNDCNTWYSLIGNR